MKTWVYFLRPVGLEGPVKIGFSVMPEHRLMAYAPWSPMKLEIAARTPGDGTLECSLHTLFRAHWLHHEWFAAAPEITAVIEAINAGTFNPKALPRGQRIPVVRRMAPRTEDQRKQYSLERRIGYQFSHNGIQPRDKKLVEQVRRYKSLSAEERLRVEALVAEFCADPIAHGRPIIWPWAKEAFAKYKQRVAAKAKPARLNVAA